MPMANVAGSRPGRIRTDPIGRVTPGRSFNNMPAIIRAFPEAISEIVIETTNHLATIAQALAPQQGQSRGRPPGSWNGRRDVAPGTLRRSEKVRFYRRRGTDITLSGRVDFKAVDPTAKEPNHSFAKAVEMGSTRLNRTIGKGGGYYHVPAQPFLWPAIQNEREPFIARLKDLERRLPR